MPGMRDFFSKCVLPFLSSEAFVIIVFVACLYFQMRMIRHEHESLVRSIQTYVVTTLHQFRDEVATMSAAGAATASSRAQERGSGSSSHPRVASGGAAGAPCVLEELLEEDDSDDAEVDDEIRHLFKCIHDQDANPGNGGATAGGSELDAGDDGRGGDGGAANEKMPPESSREEAAASAEEPPRENARLPSATTAAAAAAAAAKTNAAGGAPEDASRQSPSPSPPQQRDTLPSESANTVKGEVDVDGTAPRDEGAPTRAPPATPQAATNDAADSWLASLQGMKLVELRKLAAEKGLDTKGTKEALAARIRTSVADK